MGLSVGIFLYCFLDGSVKKIPSLFGAIELGKSGSIEYLMIVLLLYFAWRFYIYRKMESNSYLQDINDSLNNNNKFINFAKSVYQVHPENENTNIEFNGNSCIFIDSISLTSKLRLCAYKTITANGTGGKDMPFDQQIDKFGAQTLKKAISSYKLLQFLPRTIWSTTINYPGFSDFILPCKMGDVHH